MKVQYVILGSLIAISVMSTIYSIALLVGFHSTALFSSATSETTGFRGLMVAYPYGIVPVATASIGWLSVGYELLSMKEKDVRRIIRKEVSGKRDGWALYDAFKGRGGIRRLSLLETLNTPMVRNKIAEAMNMDWKEVDRNIRILETVDLVRGETLHGSVSVYKLTEKGTEVLQVIHSRMR